MESTEDRKPTRIQMKHVFIAIIVIVSTLLLLASVALITIGYLNPFGTIGLGMLGGGCVLFFSSLLFFCSGSIWLKNKYYADENDFEKWPQSASEDIALLKPASNVTIAEKNEAGCINETEHQSDNNMVPLCSVSTVYSSVSSASTVPDRTMLFNWQGGDADGALDSDVFSSSLTAMQHTDMKLQEKWKVKQGSTEQNRESTFECKIKDLEKKKIADLPIMQSNINSVSHTPRQRKPVVGDFVETTYFGMGEKQMNYHIRTQSKEDNTNTNSQIYGRNNMSDMLRPLEGSPGSAAQSENHKHMAERLKDMRERKAANELQKDYSQEWKPALEKGKIHTAEKDKQTPDRRWCVISEGDAWIHNPRVQVTTSKGLNIVPATISEPEKKHKSCEKLRES